MEHRWYKAWPVWAPKALDVDKPTSEYVREWARLTPNRIALTFYGRDISYEELNRLIDKTAWGLVKLGTKKGDRVAIHMENCPQFAIAYFAAQRAGGVSVPVNPMFKGPELEHELNDAGAHVLIGADSLYGEVEKVRRRTPLKDVVLTSASDFLPAEPALPLPEEPEKEKRAYADTIGLLELIEGSQDGPICNVKDLKSELALLQYTGGTTGTPKGAMISHHALASAALGSAHWYRHRDDDVFLGVAPFFHVMGQVTQLCDALVSGAQVIILSRFVPDVVGRAITRYRCSHWVAATTMIIALLNLRNLADYDLSSFRCIVTGGATISGELQKRLKELAPKAAIVEGYGLSETASQGGACTPLYQHRPGFVGIPQIGVDMKIVDQETGEEVAPNNEGEIAIKAEALMLGYWNRPDETALMLKNGWLYTGDTGLMDESGYIKFLGRTRELIKCSGFSVFPAEVEDLLYRHEAVREVTVIGVNDEYRGESPKAFVVLKEDCVGKVTENQILDWCKDNMAAYKRPRFIEFRKELPKSSAGKVLKRVLVEEERKKE